MSHISSLVSIYGSRGLKMDNIKTRDYMFRENLKAFDKHKHNMTLKDKKTIHTNINNHAVDLIRNVENLVSDAKSSFESKQKVFESKIRVSDAKLNLLPLLAGKSDKELMSFAEKNQDVAKILASDMGPIISNTLNQSQCMVLADKEAYEEMKEAYDLYKDFGSEVQDVCEEVAKESNQRRLTVEEEDRLEDVRYAESLTSYTASQHINQQKKEAERELRLAEEAKQREDKELSED